MQQPFICSSVFLANAVGSLAAPSAAVRFLIFADAGHLLLFLFRVVCALHLRGCDGSLVLLPYDSDVE